MAAASAIPSIPAASPITITIGTGVPDSIFTLIWDRYYQGYFKTYGLDVKLDQIEGVPQAQAVGVDANLPALEAVVAGDISGWRHRRDRSARLPCARADLIAIQLQPNSPAFYIYGDKTLKTMGDLKGN